MGLLGAYARSELSECNQPQSNQIGVINLTVVIHIQVIVTFFSFFIVNNLFGHIIDYNSTKILDRADSDRKLQIKELLHIDQKKPTLNIQLNSQSEFRINVNIIGTKK